VLPVSRVLTVTLAACALLAPVAGATRAERWVRFPDPANHFTISLPADWYDIPHDPGALEIRIADAERRHRTGLAVAYRREADTPVSAYVRFRAFQYPPLSRTPGLYTDVAVIRDPIPAGTARFTAEQATEALARGFERTPSVRGDVRRMLITLRGRKAGRLELSIAVPSGGQTYTAAAVGYVLVTKRDVFLIYFRTRPVHLARYRPVFLSIASRFET
jgi:hypothetical protein